MEPTTIIIATFALAALCGLAWLGGYELGQATGMANERQLGNRRVNALLEELNKYKPKPLKFKSVGKMRRARK